MTLELLKPRQYINLANKFAKPGDLKNLEDIGLYALLTDLLLWLHRVPDQRSKLPKGGLREWAFRKSGCGRMRFNAAWKRLRNAGLLKLTVIPRRHDRFEYIYSLLAAPDIRTPATVHLTAEKWRGFSRPEPIVPERDYLKISTKALEDPALSLKAKGMYILTAYYMELELKSKDGDDVMKSRLMERCPDGRKAFTRAWNELKRAGYLMLYRQHEEATGRFQWAFKLNASPTDCVGAGVASRAVSGGAIVRKSAAPVSVKVDREASHAPRSADERAATEALIRGNIQYDGMLKFALRAPLYYSREELDSYVKLIIDTVCTSRETVRVNSEDVPAQVVREQLLRLDCNHIRYVMARLREYRADGNSRMYKLTALYNAPDSYTEYSISG